MHNIQYAYFPTTVCRIHKTVPTTQMTYNCPMDTLLSHEATVEDL